MAAAWPCFAYFEPCLGPRGFLCFRLWLLDPCGTFVLAPEWPSSAPVWPYFAFLCFLFLLRLGPAQPSAAPRGMFGPAWPYLAYLASCSALSWPSVAFSWPSCTSCLGPCVALRGPSVGITCFAVFHTCATLGLTRSPMVWPVSWLHLVSGRLEPQASAGGEARAWPR